MSILEAIFLGVVQGLTEFLPISSSGHLKLMQALLGMKNLDQYLLFDLVCHLGTLVAICFFFKSELKQMVFKNPTRFMQLGVATLPLVPLVLFLKPIEKFYQQPDLLGGFFLITALLLFLGGKFNVPTSTTQISRKWKAPFVIGCFQALAIMPGISRSGATISAARMLGWSFSDAMTFSFLMAIPAILGGSVIQTWKMISSPAPTLPIPVYLAGLVSSAVVGYGALLFLQKVMNQKSLKYFACYCLVLGIASIIYFHF